MLKGQLGTNPNITIQDILTDSGALDAQFNTVRVDGAFASSQEGISRQSDQITLGQNFTQNELLNLELNTSEDVRLQNQQNPPAKINSDLVRDAQMTPYDEHLQVEQRISIAREDVD